MRFGSRLVRMVAITLLLLMVIACSSRRPRFVDSANAPIADSELTLLCEQGSTRAAQTDAQGRLSEASDRTDCDRAVVLYPVLTDSGRYTVYHTNAELGQPPTTSVLTDASDVELSRSLVVFHPTVSLAWDAEDEVLESIATAMGEANAQLFNATEGQAAFGQVTIYDNAAQWDAADIRILPANDMRPVAFVGSIKYQLDSATSGVTHNETRGIYLGRQWSRTGPLEGGPWNEADGVGTLVHEWAHYAFFLRDSYINADGTVNDCVPSDPNVTLMKDPYERYEFSYGTPVADCQGTPQWVIHQKDEWETLAEWDKAIGHPGPIFQLAPGMTANVPVIDTLLQVDLAQSGSNPARQGVTVLLDNPTAMGNEPGTYFAQLYTVRDSKVILHQGTIAGRVAMINDGVLGTIELLGAEADDELYVAVDLYLEGENRQYLAPQGVTVADAVRSGAVVEESDWRYGLDGAYTADGTGKITEMQWGFRSSTPLSKPELMWCVPDQPCLTFPMTGQDFQWKLTLPFGVAGMPPYGIVAIRTEEGAIIRWVRDGGGVGPSHINGHAPLTDGELMANLALPPELLVGLDLSGKEAHCVRIVIMPTALGIIAIDRELAPELSVFGPPLDVDFVIPTCGCDEAPPLENRVRLTNQYDLDWAKIFDVSRGEVTLQEIRLPPQELQRLLEATLGQRIPEAPRITDGFAEGGVTQLAALPFTSPTSVLPDGIATPDRGDQDEGPGTAWLVTRDIAPLSPEGETIVVFVGSQ